MSAGTETPDLGGMVAKLMSDPALISRIANVVGISREDGPAGEKGSLASDGETDEIKLPEGAETVLDKPASADTAAMLTEILGGKGRDGGEAAKRRALLTALRPYCNAHRRQTIDQLIKLSAVGSAAGIFGSGKGGGT